MDQAGPIAFEALRTERLLLRPLVEVDRGAIKKFEERSFDHFSRWSPAPPAGESSDQLFDRQLKRSRDGIQTGTGLRLVALELGSDAIVGRFNLNNITRGVAQYADAGWKVGLDHLGAGYATEAIWALLDVAFAPLPRGLGLHRVQANVIPGNAPSLRVAAKCGFRIEGLAREMLQINDQWQDHVMHAKLSREHVLRYLA